MTLEQENERLRTQAIADAVEIARLRSGLEELSGKCRALLKN